MNLFGKKKKEAPIPAPSITRSIGVLNDARVQLEKRQTHLTKQIAICRSEAKERLRNKDKRGALQLIRKSKLLESELNKSDGKIINIETQIGALQNAASNKEVLSAMIEGKKALQAATLPQDVDNVADVMEDINESIAMADELGEALSQPIGPVMDDDELTSELADMEADIADEQLDMKQVQKTPTIPTVTTPTTTTPTTTTTTTPTRATVTDEINALPTPSTKQISTSTATATGGKKPQLSKAEEDELKNLESLMS